MEIHFVPKGVCTRRMDIDLDMDKKIIKGVCFTGGCSGNTQAVAALAQGMPIEEYIIRCKRIRCGSRTTSCPAQLALALEEALKENKKK